ncbi:aldose 1-epimerase [Actinomyces sp. Chiba101]|uniref:D-hexose-6-phosphate mutarotase n=1 Tax=Actinomyces TaxID=1654 RepID=UPI000974EAB5|nr:MULTISPECIES: D-hexose-6-phosphate mutarotase [Actinomyces]BAW92999.1 aldose 1-epimerase [Actinomyces sp. Chiba101]GAV94017.1 aldose 1-epimerase [Actinomyces denticolens]SUU05695.1 Putative glucose-6-phosphate 1-epimerase [Actinomyces denticolens]
MSPSRRAGSRPPFRLPRAAALTPGRGGQPRLLVDAPSGAAEIYLHGAHLTSWAPRGGGEALFTSRKAVFDGETAIRGGVPLCLPWFASGPDGARRPSHGWARIMEWELRCVETRPDGSVRVLMALEHDGLSLLYEISVGEELGLSLSVSNRGTAPRSVEAALHTYLRVGDVTAVRIIGLEGCEYTDKTAGGATSVQAGPLGVRGPVDRIYESGAPTTVFDPALGRRVRVSPAGSAQTVVWNPWSSGAAALTDMAEEEFPTMVCVETARLGRSAALLGAGETMAMGTALAVEPL